MGHPPLRSSQKNPITAVFGDQQDYSVSKEKQSGLICCPSLAGVTSCNEVPYFSLPPFFISSPTSPTVIWHFSPPAFPSRPGFFTSFFFKWSFHPFLSLSCIPRSCCSTTSLWVAHMRRERLSFSLMLKTAQRPCGCWWPLENAAFSPHLLTPSYEAPPPLLPPHPWAMWLSDDGELKACSPSLLVNNSPPTPKREQVFAKNNVFVFLFFFF